VGRPSLNHDDSQLAEALREVAAIAQSSEMAIPQLPLFDRTSDARETREVHAPPPKVIPAEPLPPAERLEPPLPPKLHPSARSARVDSPETSDEETLYSRGPLEQLASLAGMEEPEPSASTSPLIGHGQYQWTNEVPWKLWLAFVAVGFSALVTGFVLGRWDRTREPLEQPAPANTKVTSSSAPEPIPNSHVDVLMQLGQLAVQGTVKYSEAGQGSAIKPDANAWIYAFPILNESGAKIPSAWFKSQNSEMGSSLQVLGGNATQANQIGDFQLHLLHQGKYLLLICSEHKSRDRGESGQKQPPEVLKQYFDNPDDFLGDRDFHSQELDYQGKLADLDLDPL
jgi:hypothetical protein